MYALLTSTFNDCNAKYCCIFFSFYQRTPCFFSTPPPFFFLSNKSKLSVWSKVPVGCHGVTFINYCNLSRKRPSAAFPTGTNYIYMYHIYVTYICLYLISVLCIHIEFKSFLKYHIVMSLMCLNLASAQTALVFIINLKSFDMCVYFVRMR